MTHDIRHELHAADPARDTVPYSEERIRAEVAAVLAADGATPPRSAPAREDVIEIGRPLAATRRGAHAWAVSAAAAAVVAATVGGALLTGGNHDSGGADRAAADGGVTLSCAVGAAGRPASTGQLRSAERIVAQRLTASGATVTREHFGTDQVTVTARGVDRRAASAACLAPAPSVRPLVTHSVHQDATGPRSADPLARLGFPVPRDEPGYARLAPAQQRALHTAMGRFDCSDAVDAGRDGATLACSAVSASGSPTRVRTVYLLEPVLVSPDGFSSAAATPPSADRGGSPEWTVDAMLTRAAAQAFGAYTGAHHIGGKTPAADGTSCAPGSVPCADVLGYLSGTAVRSAAITLAPITGGNVQLSGDYDESSARALADDITAAAIGLRPVR